MKALCQVPGCLRLGKAAGGYCFRHFWNPQAPIIFSPPCVCTQTTPEQRARMRRARGDTFWMFEPPVCGESCSKQSGERQGTSE